MQQDQEFQEDWQFGENLINPNYRLAYQEPLGILTIKRVKSTMISSQVRQPTRMRRISVIDFIEMYSYTSLLIIFAYIVALAIIGMTYGGTKSQP